MKATVPVLFLCVGLSCVGFAAKSFYRMRHMKIEPVQVEVVNPEQKNKEEIIAAYTKGVISGARAALTIGQQRGYDIGEITGQELSDVVKQIENGGDGK